MQFQSIIGKNRFCREFYSVRVECKRLNFSSELFSKKLEIKNKYYRKEETCRRVPITSPVGRIKNVGKVNWLEILHIASDGVPVTFAKQ